MTNITPIFPNASRDTENRIISFSDHDSLVVLSGANRNAYRVLSNNEFFKQRFEEQHPHLTKFNNIVFKALRNYHPNNCWKVVSSAFSEKGCPRAKPSFIEEAILPIWGTLTLKKMQYEMRIKEICGSHYADPSSSIDQAWKDYAKGKQELATLEEIIKPLQLVHSEGNMNMVLILIECHRDRLSNRADETIGDELEAGNFMKKSLLPHYRLVADYYKGKNELRVKFLRYEELEKERSHCGKIVQELGEKLAFAKDRGIFDEHQIRIEKILSSLPWMEEGVTAIANGVSSVENVNNMMTLISDVVEQEERGAMFDILFGKSQ
jgi:hypothetical protein